MFPIKYIEDNLVLNQGGEWFAYYEMVPYNYSFLSSQQKMQLHHAFRQMVAQSRDGKIHALQIASESSIREKQERCKEHVTGELRETACKIIDAQTEAFVNNPSVGEYQVDYRFFIGFKLMISAGEVNLKKIKESVIMTFKDFVGEVNHKLMGDFMSVSNEETRRYKRLEKMLETKISKHFGFKRMTERDFGYLIEHLYGQETPYCKYDYKLPVEKQEKETIVKKYDLLKLTGCLMEEHQRYVKIIREKSESYAAYLTIQTLTNDLMFPSSEIFYYQQDLFDYPFDTSMNVEILENRKALATVRNKHKELKDLDDHAWGSGNETEEGVVNALDDVKELETELGQTKEAMYKLSYVVRVTAHTLDELEERCNEIKDFYDSRGVKLVCPFGDMIGLHQEFIPSRKRYINDYVQYVTADFLAGLGFGAARILGDESGIYIGFDSDTGKNVYIDPSLACQGEKGTTTNSPAMSFTGTLGTGKSFYNNIVVFFSVLFGGKVLIIDPKSERGGWKKDLTVIADKINIVNLTSEEENRGMLDPFIILKDKERAESLAIEILTFLTGISNSDGNKYPYLWRAVDAVLQREQRGMLLVIEELRKMNHPSAEGIADHIESFVNCDFAKLMFSDGNGKRTIDMDSQMNIIQVQDLLLPSEGTEPGAYTNVERLSVAVMIVISTFALEFIKIDRNIFKIVDLDEAWSFLQVAQGKALSNRLVREGRSMQAGVYFVTQSCGDLLDEKIKNNIGLKFAFRSTDIVEIKNILMYFGLDAEDEENQKRIQNLENGQCLMQDRWGRIGMLNVDAVFSWLHDGFDTRPKKGVCI